MPPCSVSAAAAACSVSAGASDLEHLPAAVEAAAEAAEQAVAAIQELGHYGSAADEAVALQLGGSVGVGDSPAGR